MPVSQEKLALLGGQAALSVGTCPEWPPRNEETALRLAELYMSGNWSFNLGGEDAALCEEFAAYHDARCGVFMVNGTATLHCALATLGVGAGDEVIVPAFAWLATAMAAHYVGAKIVFVDVEPTTLCLDPAKVEAAITERTKAIVPVHLYGSMADMDAIMAIADRHGLAVVEDCAQGHGGKWDGKGVGSLGHIGSFSFQHNKLMTSGEGGICITNDPELYDRLYRMKHIGYGPGEGMDNFTQTPNKNLICYNFRGTEFQALILRDQLKTPRPMTETYNRNALRLEARLADVPDVRVQSRGRLADPQGYYRWVVLFDDEPLEHVPLDLMLKAINAEGVPLEPTYGAVYAHRLFNLTSDDQFVVPPWWLPSGRRRSDLPRSGSGPPMAW